jgi:hypothetical protein
MASIPELPQPGVEVIQELQTASPVIVLPTLIPCVVGACKEIREVLDSDGDLDTDSLISGPAIATAPNAEASYTVMSLLTLQVSIDDGATQTFTMPNGAGTMTAQEVENAINGATIAPVDFEAFVVHISTAHHLELRTTASGATKKIKIVGGTVCVKLGFPIGTTYYGIGNYIQDKIVLRQSSFPNPRGIDEDEMDIDEDTIRVFFDLGVTPREILRSESFLRKGGGTASDMDPVDDSDGDLTTPYVALKTGGAAVNLIAGPGAASVTGTVDLATAQALHNLDLVLQVDGGGKQTVRFYGQPIVSTDSAGWDWGAPDPAITGKAIHLLVNGTVVNIASVASASLTDLVTEINVASMLAVGVNIAYKCDSNGNTAASTYLGLFYGAVPENAPTANTVVSVAAYGVAGDAHAQIWGDNLAHVQKVGKSSAGPVDDVATQINALFSSTIASYTGNFLKLTSPTTGYESKLEIYLTASPAVGAQPPAGATLLGIDCTTLGSSWYGSPYALRIGDALYADGYFIGYVIELLSMGFSNYVKLDREMVTATHRTN